jgi:hypothetical protein
MKETDQQLAEILKKGLEAAEKTGNFVVEQAPDLIQQLIVWKTCEYIFLIIISIAFIFSVYKWHKSAMKRYDDFIDFCNEIESFIYGAYAIVVIVIFGIALFQSFFNLIQILLAPKIWLIEYASQLIK